MSQQLPHDLGVAILCCANEWRCAMIDVAHVDYRAVLEQKCDDIRIPSFRCKHERAYIGVAQVANVGIHILQEPAHLVAVADLGRSMQRCGTLVACTLHAGRIARQKKQSKAHDHWRGARRPRLCNRYR